MRWSRKMTGIHLIQFVKQRAIAHLEPFGSLLPVPIIGAQYLEDDLALEVKRGLLGDALERERLAEVDVGDDAVACERLRHQLSRKKFLIADEHVAADQIGELADVARPVVALHELDSGAGDRLG